jgi:hypothetical protein
MPDLLIAKNYNDDCTEVPTGYIMRVLGEVALLCVISIQGIIYIQKLLNPMLHNCDIGSETNIIDYKYDNVVNFVQDNFTGKLKKHVLRELYRTKTKYIRYVVLEYLMAEILELTSLSSVTSTICQYDIEEAIMNNDELISLFNKLNIINFNKDTLAKVKQSHIIQMQDIEKIIIEI